MKTNIIPGDGYVEVQLEGRLVASCAEAVQDAFDRALEKSHWLIADLTRMSHIDSSGLGVLVRTLQRARATEGGMRIACLQPHPRIVFDITKVFRVFDIYDTLEEARKGFGH